MSQPIRLVIFGRQGAGKGTQCLRLTEKYGIAHISTGDMLRSAVAEGTDMGLKAKAVMDSGNLVGDEIMHGIVRERLAQDDATTVGFVLDGYPRTINQAEVLLEILGDSGLNAVVNLEVPIEEVTERMQARGREDDTPEGIGRRLELYEQETSPVLDFFGELDLLRVVDGFAPEHVVTERLYETVELAISVEDPSEGDDPETAAELAEELLEEE